MRSRQRFSRTRLILGFSLLFIGLLGWMAWQVKTFVEVLSAGNGDMSVYAPLIATIIVIVAFIFLIIRSIRRMISKDRVARYMQGKITELEGKGNRRTETDTNELRDLINKFPPNTDLRISDETLMKLYPKKY